MRQCLALERRATISVQINGGKNHRERRGDFREAYQPPQIIETHFLREESKTRKQKLHLLEFRSIFSTPQSSGTHNHPALPDRTLRLRGRGAIPGRAPLSRSLETTCRWPHRTAGRGWSLEPCRQRKHRSGCFISSYIWNIFLICMKWLTKTTKTVTNSHRDMTWSRHRQYLQNPWEVFFFFFFTLQARKRNDAHCLCRSCRLFTNLKANSNYPTYTHN